jgi:hypothetical protein
MQSWKKVCAWRRARRIPRFSKELGEPVPATVRCALGVRERQTSPDAAVRVLLGMGGGEPVFLREPWLWVVARFYLATARTKASTPAPRRSSTLSTLRISDE